MSTAVTPPAGRDIINRLDARAERIERGES